MYYGKCGSGVSTRKKTKNKNSETQNRFAITIISGSFYLLSLELTGRMRGAGNKFLGDCGLERVLALRANGRFCATHVNRR